MSGSYHLISQAGLNRCNLLYPATLLLCMLYSAGWLTRSPGWLSRGAACAAGPVLLFTFASSVTQYLILSIRKYQEVPRLQGSDV